MLPLKIDSVVGLVLAAAGLLIGHTAVESWVVVK